MEALRAEYKALCEEEESLKSQLGRAKLDAQMLLLRLQTIGAGSDVSLVPAQLRAGSGVGGARRSAELATAEHSSLLKWLAEGVDTSQHTEFNAPGAVRIGAHDVTLGHMVQWPLSGVSSDLKLSVPKELEQEIVALLNRVRRGHVGINEMVELSQSWEFLGADVTAEDGPQPAIFLVRPESSKACVIAAWPTLAPPPAPESSTPTPAFDPVAHLQSESSNAAPVAEVARTITFVDARGAWNTLEVVTVPGDGGRDFAAHRLEWSTASVGPRIVDELGVRFDTDHRCTLSGPFGPVAVVDPAPGHAQRKLVEQILQCATECKVKVRADGGAAEARPTDHPDENTCFETLLSTTQQRMLEVASGDDVEVHYQGQWYAGVLQFVAGEVAHINCHVDGPGVITMVHVSSVRPAPRLHRRANGEPPLH